jgi:hypothetical protein
VGAARPQRVRCADAENDRRLSGNQRGLGAACPGARRRRRDVDRQDSKRLHYGKYDRQKQQLDSQEISVTARHIFGRGVVAMAWQRDPNRILWMAMPTARWRRPPSCRNRKSSPLRVTRAPTSLSRTSPAFPVSPPASTKSTCRAPDHRRRHQALRRTAGGFFEPADPDAPTAEGAWFVDCGLRVTGSGMMNATQLVHLEGQEVAVFADGAMQTRKTVAAGAIAFDRPTDDAVIGIPVRGYLRDLPRNLQGTTAKQKRVAEADVHILHAGGGQIRAYDPENVLPFDASPAQIRDDRESWEDIVETGANDYDAAPPLMSGQFRMNVEGNIRDEAQLELVCDDAMPFTLLGLSPVIEIEEDD